MFKFLKFFNKGPVSTPEISITTKESNKFNKLLTSNSNALIKNETIDFKLLKKQFKTAQKERINFINKTFYKKIRLKRIFSFSNICKFTFKTIWILISIFIILIFIFMIWKLITVVPGMHGLSTDVLNKAWGFLINLPKTVWSWICSLFTSSQK